jgi:hypothetical protein
MNAREQLACGLDRVAGGEMRRIMHWRFSSTMVSTLRFQLKTLKVSALLIVDTDGASRSRGGTNKPHIRARSESKHGLAVLFVTIIIEERK